MAIKTFTTGEVLTAADTNTYLANAGWDYVTRIDLGGNTAVNADNIFTATYDTYQIIVSNYRATSGAYLFFQTRSGSPATTDTGTNYVYKEGTGAQATDQTNWRPCYAYNTTDRGNANIIVYEPLNSATGTSIQYTWSARNSTTNFDLVPGIGQKETQTIDTGLRFTNNISAAMNGQITVLGLRKP